MFKCTICSQEYKIKPEYCDCGNDTFLKIADETPALKAAPTMNFSEFPVQKLLSVFIFVLCILLSVVILSIKPTETKTEKKKEPEKVTMNIPDIDKIWDSTPPKEKPKYTTDITVYEKPKKTKQIIPNFDLLKPKQETKPQQVKKTTPKPKQVQTPIKTQKPVQQQQKPQHTQQTQQPKPQQQKPVVQKPAQNIQSKPKPVVKPAPTPVEIKTMNAQEWSDYKNSLRYALLSKLDLVKIVGEGDCAVEFSFDNSGKLLNRRFVYKSQNKTVNDEVYLMLMKLPVFKTPPTNYNGEKVKIKFYINNGYYEISFMN